MKMFLALIFVLSLGKSFSQTFLDSIYYNIPFDADQVKTNELLSKNKDFIFFPAHHLPDGHYTVLLKNPIPNKALSITYSKSPIKFILDGKIIDSCSKFSSTILFTYKTRARAKRDFKKIICYLERRLHFETAAGLVGLSEKKYGHEFYFSKTKYCNFMSITCKEHSTIGYYIEISYH